MRTTTLTQGQPSALPRGHKAFLLNELRSSSWVGAEWHTPCKILWVVPKGTARNGRMPCHPRWAQRQRLSC